MNTVVPNKVKRMNLTLQEDVIKMIKLLAYNDNVSPTTKAAEILKNGLELEEDTILVQIAEKRLEDIKNGESKMVPHDNFWEKALKE